MLKSFQSRSFSMTQTRFFHCVLISLGKSEKYSPTLGQAVAQEVKRLSTNGMVGGSIPVPCSLYVEVFLGKILNPLILIIFSLRGSTVNLAYYMKVNIFLYCTM